MQVDAHIGGVNDLAFAHPNKQLCIVTCGDDKLVKVHKSTPCNFRLCIHLLYCLKKRLLIGVGFDWTETI